MERAGQNSHQMEERMGKLIKKIAGRGTIKESKTKAGEQRKVKEEEKEQEEEEEQEANWIRRIRTLTLT